MNLLRHAATLCAGLIKNHPCVCGNKRAATAVVDEFLSRNGAELAAAPAGVVELILAADAGRWQVIEVGAWPRQRGKNIHAR